MTDETTFLERSRKQAELNGRSFGTPEELAGNFTLFAPSKRVEILNAIERDLGAGSPKQAIEEWRHFETLRTTHQQLLKARR